MTVRGIAELAGVSIGTVDRVLHGRGRVSPETRTRILTIVHESGYAPNPIARHLKLNRRHTFALIMPELDADSGYWSVAHAGVMKALRELAAFGVDVECFTFDRYDRNSFVASVASFDPQAFSGILMAPVLPDESQSFLARLPQDFPVVFFDAQIPTFSPLTRIGQNAFQSGVLAGRLLEAFSRQSGDYLVISVHSEDFHIRERIEGFRSFFGKNKRNILLREYFDIEHRENLDAIVRRLAGEADSFAGIFVTSASVHGIASELNSARQSRHIAIVGYDLVPENVRGLRAGTIDCILSQRQDRQGYQGLYQLYRHVVLSQRVESEIEIPIDVYLKENLPGRAAAKSRTDPLAQAVFSD